MSYETDHPASADLLAVVLGTLDGEDRDPIEEHLSRCPECAQTVLDFNSFPDLEPVDEESPEMRARLEDQKRRLIEMGRREEAGSSEAPESSSRGPWLARAWLARPGLAWAVAAVFFGTTVGLAVWGGGHVARELGAIDPLEGWIMSSRSPGEEPKEVPLVGNETVIGLRLQPYARKHSRYRVVLKPEPGGEEISGPKYRLFSPDSLLVAVPNSLVSPGFYRFEVYGVDADSEDTFVGLLRVEFVAGSETEIEDE